MIPAVESFSFARRLATHLYKEKMSDFDLLKNMYVERYGIGHRRGLKAGLNLLPAVGPAIEKLLFEPNIEFIYSGEYPPLIHDLLFQFFKVKDKSFPNMRIVVCISNSWLLDAASLELLSGILSLKTVSIIMDQRAENEMIVTRLDASPAARSIHCDFNSPDYAMFLEMAMQWRPDLSSVEGISIFEKSAGNIYSMLIGIKKTSIDLPSSIDIGSENMDYLSKQILLILHVSEMPVGLADLMHILKDSSDINYFDESDWKRSQSFLLSNKLILGIYGPDEYSFVINRSHPSIPIFEKADILVAQDRICDYYKRNGLSELSLSQLEMISRLSIGTMRDDIYGKSVKELILRRLRLGTFIADEEVAYLQARITDRKDIPITIMFLAQNRKYTEALEMLETLIKEDERNIPPYYEVLYAILLNRCRKHLDARRVLEGLLVKDHLGVENKAVLLAYLIANHLHENNAVRAQECIPKWESIIGNTNNFGYCLRNAASIGTDVFNMLDRAAIHFTRSGDSFGLATVYANHGKHLCVAGKYKNGLDIMRQAEGQIAEHGDIHQHIIRNNIGIVYSVTHEYEEAIKYLRAAEIVARNEMPSIYTRINIALLHFRRKNYRKASEIINELLDRVEKSHVDRIRQVFYPNAAIIALMDGNSKFDWYCQKSLKHPNRYSRKRTKSTIKKAISLKRMSSPPFEEVVDLISPCYMEYWYVNPIKAVDGLSLPF